MPEASLADLRSRLVEKQERVAELEARRADLESERREVKRRYAEAVAAHEPFGEEEILEKFSLPTLREKVDALGTETSTLAEVEPEIQSAAAAETSTLSMGERERVRELESQLEDLPEHDRGLVARQREHLEAELAEIRGEA